MSDYEITNCELRVLLRHYWRKNLDAKAAAKAICDVEGEGTGPDFWRPGPPRTVRHGEMVQAFQ